MSRDLSSRLLLTLSNIDEAIESLESDAEKVAFLRELSGCIDRLNKLRHRLENEVAESSDFHSECGDCSPVVGTNGRSPNTTLSRLTTEIPNNLNNAQIRELLTRKLSRGELKAIAEQRGISGCGMNMEEIRSRITQCLELQESYELLARA